MRVAFRIVSWLLGVVAATALLLVASVATDALIGRGRLDPLVNTSIAQPSGPAVRAFVARPSTPGPHPAVIMIHEWWGLRADVVGKAQALADEGYLVVAPDLFRGSTTEWIPRAIYQVSTTPPAQIDSDLAAVYAWVAAQPDVQPNKIGVMGFCFGGGTALRYSLSNPQLAATAIFYGSPITDVARLKALPGPVLGVFGGADTMIPPSEVRAFDAALQQAGVSHTVTIYDGQPHAFVTTIDEIRKGGPQGEAWAQLLAFLKTSLKGDLTGALPRAPLARAAAHGWSADRALHLFVCDRAVWRAS